MTNKRLPFGLILACSSLSYTGISAATLVILRDEGVSASAPLMAAGIGGLCLFALVWLTIYPLSRPYSLDFARLALDDPKAYSSSLAALGGAPLSSLVRLILLIALSLGALSLGAGKIGVPESLKGAILVFLLSWGLLSAAFTYVLTDNQVLTTLLGLGISAYPQGLRESRQLRKNFIIPVFMSVMSILYTFSAVIIFVAKAEGAGFGSIVLKALPLTIAFFVVIIILMIIWTANTARLFRSVIDKLERISSSEKDLTSRIAVASVDEIATIAGMVNSFCGTLGESVADLRRAYDEISGVERRLFEGIRASSSAAAEMAGAIEGSAAAVEREDEATKRGLSRADEVSRLAADMATKVKAQGKSLAGSAEGIESVLEAVGSISREAAGALEKSEELVVSVREGEEGIKASVETVSSVAARSADLASLNKLIAAVASRTNLLAMNASIEAAHAGAAGAGFSVVAEEIRTLAASTAEHTKQSKARIGEMLALIDKALAVSETTRTSFAKVRSSAEEVHRASGAMASAMVEQERRGKEVLSLLAHTETLAKGASETALALDGVARDLASRLGAASAAASESRAIAEAMRGRNEELRRTTAEVDGLGARAAELHVTMASLLGSFKTR